MWKSCREESLTTESINFSPRDLRQTSCDGAQEWLAADHIPESPLSALALSVAAHPKQPFRDQVNRVLELFLQSESRWQLHISEKTLKSTYRNAQFATDPQVREGSDRHGDQHRH